jgi:two-component system, NarL family, nitrate/nitrite response regulator NarL
MRCPPFGPLSWADARCQDVGTTPDPDGTNEGIRVHSASELHEGDMSLRVLVVDDHPAFRKALTSALRMVANIEVVGEAGGGVAACVGAEELHPDVVLMDLSMPDLSGIDAMKKIHETRPDLPVVILTAHADEGVEREARESGAVGFLAKGTGLQELVVTLHRAASNESEDTGEVVL